MNRFPTTFGRVPPRPPDAEPVAVPAGTTHAYRPDIDGLRALAVLSVIFYHAGFRGFGGGFVGVDIFFVISGYLITGILVRDLTQGKHTIGRFYRRRVLRIFPALFCVAAATTAAACIILMPDELIRYAQSLAATTLFGSNMLFNQESGYFEALSEAKPLLHTWSLAIEEQFYILWPLLLTIAGAARPARLRIVVWSVCAVSLAAAIAMVAQDRGAAFYLLPSRAWELALGGALATISLRIANRWINEALAAVGVLAILWCCWKFNVQTSFPGAGALPVCLGAALIIFTGLGRGTFVSRLLSIRPAVFVGKISYSLYLWHWPVLVFASISLIAEPSLSRGIAAVAVSFILAILSWRYVETPFRVAAPRWSDKAVFAGAAVAMAGALGFAGLLVATDGLAQRYTAEQRAVARFAGLSQAESYRGGTCFIDDYRQRYRDDECLPARGAKPLVLLIGDSYGAHLWPGLATLRDRYDIAQANLVGCTPGIYPGKAGKTCERFFRSILTGWVRQQRPDAVLLAGRWLQQDFALLRQTLKDPRLADTQLILVGPPPQYDISLPRLLVEADRRNQPSLIRRFADPNVPVVDKELRRIANAASIPYISLTDTLCRQGKCRVWAQKGIPLQFDDGHFSEQGSREVVRLIEGDLAPLIAKARAERRR